MADYTERLTVEVKRSFLYFKQRFRGKEVSKGILSGDMQGLKTRDAPSSTNLRKLARLLAKELDIGVEVFGIPTRTTKSQRDGLAQSKKRKPRRDPSQSSTESSQSFVSGLEISLPREKTSEFKNLFPSLTIPIGLAIAGLRQSRVNLLSQKGIRGKSLWRTDAILRAAASILLLILLGSYLGTSITNFYTRKTKLATLKELELLRPELKNISKYEEETRQHTARLFLIERLNAPSSHEVDWSELFREISWLVHDEIVFNTFEARQEKGRTQHITIKGMTHSKSVFNVFLTYLQNSSSLSVLSSHQKINPQIPSKLPFIKGGKRGLKRTQKQLPAQVFDFVIECEVEQ